VVIGELVAQTGILLRCLECGARSDQLATGWRAYLAPEEEDEARARSYVLP
jgi:hypothetical protein